MTTSNPMGLYLIDKDPDDGTETYHMTFAETPRSTCDKCPGGKWHFYDLFLEIPRKSGKLLTPATAKAFKVCRDCETETEIKVNIELPANHKL